MFGAIESVMDERFGAMHSDSEEEDDDEDDDWDDWD